MNQTPISKALAATAQAVGMEPDAVRRVVHTYAGFVRKERNREESTARRRIVDEARAASAEQLRERRGGAVAPTREREKRGEIIDAGISADVPGQARKRSDPVYGVRPKVALDPIDGMAARKYVTARHVNAAHKFRVDFEVGIEGARDGGGRDPMMPASSHGNPSGYTPAQIQAAERYAMAVRAMGPSLSHTVIAVVCSRVTIEELAKRLDPKGELRRQVSLQLMYALKAGLDRLGDHQGAPSELGVASVSDGEVSARIQYRQEAHDRFAAVWFGDEPWLAEAKSVHALMELARAKLRGPNG